MGAFRFQRASWHCRHLGGDCLGGTSPRPSGSWTLQASSGPRAPDASCRGLTPLQDWQPRPLVSTRGLGVASPHFLRLLLPVPPPRPLLPTSQLEPCLKQKPTLVLRSSTVKFQVEPRAGPRPWALGTSHLPRALVAPSRARVFSSLLVGVWHRVRVPQEVFPTPRILQSSPHRGTSHCSWSPSASSASLDTGTQTGLSSSFLATSGSAVIRVRVAGRWPGLVVASECSARELHRSERLETLKRSDVAVT